MIWAARWLMAGLAVASLTAPAAAREPVRKVIIDDDGFGLKHVMLLEAKDVEVLGITTVSGDAWANRVTAAALHGLEVIGRTDVPVVPGATYPLLNSEALTERWEALYGRLTWKGAWMRHWVEPTTQPAPAYHGPDDTDGLPATRTVASTEIAANFIIRMVHAHPHEVTIIACGPLTNLALALRLDPGVAQLTRELVYMGGSFDPRQELATPAAAQFAREFATSPRREFNTRFDPEAASIVSRSRWPKITVVPVDPSTATELTPALKARLAASASPGVASFVAGLAPGFPMWDEIAAAVWLDPTLVREAEPLFVDYDTQFGPGFGDTLSWRAGYQPGLGEQPATVVRAIDVPRFEDAMRGLLQRGSVAR